MRRVHVGTTPSDPEYREVIYRRALSTDFGFSEDETTPPGASIGLTDDAGKGSNFSDFVPSDFHFPQTDNLNATPGEPNFFQTFDIPNLCPAPFAIDAFLASPSNAERVDILTTPNTNTIQIRATTSANGFVGWGQCSCFRRLSL